MLILGALLAIAGAINGGGLPIQQQQLGSEAPGANSSTLAYPSAPPSAATALLSVNEELSSRTVKVGTPFTATLLESVTEPGGLVIPRGAIAHGEVTFSSGRGGFGRGGIVAIALRYLEVDGHKIALHGRYREVGKEPEAAVVATTFAVGVFSGFIKGRSSTIPRGRVLRARLGEGEPTAAPSSNAGNVATSSQTATAIITPRSTSGD